MVHRDMDNPLASKSYRMGLDNFGINIIQQFFDFQKIHKQLLGIYHLAITSYALDKGEGGKVCEEQKLNKIR